ncbi:putative metal-binding motif-containing protein [Myxococcota bacterium]|nr:putative metal-binding motif-containing protein [Myxococcota bacterium]
MTSIFLVLALLACKDKGDNDADDTGPGADDTGSPVYADLDQDGFTSDVDCDDTNPAINPSAAELCDEVDNDCDDAVDEGLTGAFYVDADGDGYGDPSRIVEACELEPGLADNPDDCDDTDDDVHPDAAELCNGQDDDCDELLDEPDAFDARTWYLDEDQDGWGDEEKTTVACDAPELYTDTFGDCDDEDDAVNPGASELCNDQDDDCDRDVDEDAIDAPTWFRDRDNDLFGIDDEFVIQCDPPTGFAASGGDCDDTDDEINPGAEEICDDIDNDCDATTSEDGLVTLEAVDGSIYDVTSYFADGTYSSPTTVTMSGDGTFSFCRGTYYVRMVLQADIEIVGVHGADETTFSAGDAVSVIEVQSNGVDASITGVTIRDGLGSGRFFGSPAYSTGGGLYCAASATVAIVDSVITANTAEVGGGIYVEGCDVTLRDTEISDCAADYGGGIAVGDGDASVTDSILTDNVANYSGGAAYVDGSGDVSAGMSLSSSIVELNEAQYGGGVAVFEAAFACSGSSGVEAGFFDNEGSLGGAAFVDTPESFRSNTCDWGEGSTDNTPVDIFVVVSENEYDYGNDASFTCGTNQCND